MAKKSKTPKKVTKAKTTKKPTKQLFRVETYSTLKNSYLVEATSPWAAEAHLQNICQSNDPPEEWQQTYLGETVVSLTVVTRKEAEREHVRPEPKVMKCHWLPVERFILHAEDVYDAS